MEGMKILLERVDKKNVFYQRRFSGLTRIKKRKIVDELEDAIPGISENDIEDVPMLLTLLLLATLFVPKNCLTLHGGYIKNVNDLEKIKTYVWSTNIFEKLYSSLCNYNDPKDVTECVMALPYWGMGNFNIGEPQMENNHLLCQKWNLKNLTRLTKEALITDVCNSKNIRIKEKGEKPIAEGVEASGDTVVYV